MLIGPVLALLLVLLFYKRDVNPMGTVWLPPHARSPRPPASASSEPASPARWLLPAPSPVEEPADPMDLNDVFRRR